LVVCGLAFDHQLFNRVTDFEGEPVERVGVGGLDDLFAVLATTPPNPRRGHVPIVNVIKDCRNPHSLSLAGPGGSICLKELALIKAATRELSIAGPLKASPVWVMRATPFATMLV
jgi:hypothetical protein